jgi:hypothetical protein
LGSRPRLPQLRQSLWRRTRRQQLGETCVSLCTPRRDPHCFPVFLICRSTCFPGTKPSLAMFSVHSKSRSLCGQQSKPPTLHFACGPSFCRGHTRRPRKPLYLSSGAHGNIGARTMLQCRSPCAQPSLPNGHL